MATLKFLNIERARLRIRKGQELNQLMKVICGQIRVQVLGEGFEVQRLVQRFAEGVIYALFFLVRLSAPER